CHSIRHQAAAVDDDEDNYDDRGRRHRRVRLHRGWREGDPIPAGAHVEERVKTPLIIAGAIMFGVAWVFEWTFTIAACSRCDAMQIPMSFVPVVGPFLQAPVGLNAAGHNVTNNGALYLAAPFEIIQGFLEAGGVAMLIVGAATTHKVLIYDTP